MNDCVRRDGVVHEFRRELARKGFRSFLQLMTLPFSESDT